MIKPFHISFLEEEKRTALDSFQKILDNEQLTLGPYTQQFESAFTSISSTPYACAVSSGTVALEIIFRSLNTDRPILVPANTNYATVAAVISAGLQPVLYDGGIYPDVNDLRKKIEISSPGAIVVVHIGGYISPEIAAIKKLCEENNIPLVEDAAHAHGATSDNMVAGSIGHSAAFSFFPTKVMTTCEGGMIVTDNKALAEAAQLYRDQGKDSSGNKNVVLGSSWRMSELHAALGLAQIKHFKSKLAHRRAILERYAEALPKKFKLAGLHHSQASGHKAILLTHDKDTRDRLRQHLASNQIGTSKGVYEIPIHLQPVFKHLNTSAYPLAEAFADTHLCLPIWSTMTFEQLDGVIASINEFN